MYRQNALKRELNKLKSHKKNVEDDKEFMKNHRFNDDGNVIQKTEAMIQNLERRHALAEKKQ